MRKQEILGMRFFAVVLGLGLMAAGAIGGQIPIGTVCGQFLSEGKLTVSNGLLKGNGHVYNQRYFSHH